jgi:hypothetical protein
MNQFLAERYVEIVHRLLLGIEPVDAARRSRIGHPIEVAIEGPPFPPWPPQPAAELERYLRQLLDSRRTLSDTMARVPRHATCRHALLHRPDLTDHVDVRLFDRGRRFVPRRLRIPLTPLSDPTDPALLDAVPFAERVRRPSLFPGKAYDVSESATGIRGRVVRPDPLDPAKELPVRWPRVRALIGTSPVGWAHGDQNGDFLLLLDSSAVPAVTLTTPLAVNVTAYAPPAPPVPASALLPRVDEYWDLPLEVLAAPGVTPDPTGAGDYVPTTYTAASTPPPPPVTFRYGVLLGGLAPFVLP